MRILVTGASGLLGRHVCALLKSLGHMIASGAWRLEDGEEVTPASRKWRAWQSEAPYCDAIIHCAGVVSGSIAGQSRRLADYVNLDIDSAALAAWDRHPEIPFVGCSSVAVYGPDAEWPFRESAIWQGYPHPDHASYAIAKRCLIDRIEARREQGRRGSALILANLYGPGDRVAPDPRLVAGIASRAIHACATGKPLELAGTGQEGRDLLYVADAAHAILLALCHSEGVTCNIGGGSSNHVTTRRIAGVICDAVGYSGDVKWDGVQRGMRCATLDVSAARAELGYIPSMHYEQGLRLTVEAMIDPAG